MFFINVINNLQPIIKRFNDRNGEIGPSCFQMRRGRGVYFERFK